MHRAKKQLEGAKGCHSFSILFSRERERSLIHYFPLTCPCIRSKWLCVQLSFLATSFQLPTSTTKRVWISGIRTGTHRAEIPRCDKPNGKMHGSGWLKFEQVGQGFSLKIMRDLASSIYCYDDHLTHANTFINSSPESRSRRLHWSQTSKIISLGPFRRDDDERFWNDWFTRCQISCNITLMFYVWLSYLIKNTYVEINDFAVWR